MNKTSILLIAFCVYLGIFFTISLPDYVILTFTIIIYCLAYGVDLTTQFICLKKNLSLKNQYFYFQNKIKNLYKHYTVEAAKIIVLLFLINCSIDGPHSTIRDVAVSSAYLLFVVTGAVECLNKYRKIT